MTTAAAWSAPQRVDRGQDVVEVGHRAKRSRGQAGPGRLAPRRLAPPADGAFARRGHAGTMHFASGRRTRAVAPLLAALLILLTASVATATEFPAGRTGYHSYTEVTAEVAALAAAHPDIVHRFSIGKSYKGRDIWAVKISDNVGVDEAEPEVMFDGGHHADEHMCAEMTLSHHALARRWLRPRPADHEHRRHARDLDRLRGQPRRRRVRHLRRQVPLLAQEPPADARDHARSGPTSTATTAIAGAAAGGPARTRATSPTAAPSAFSTPEARAMRDFMASRVVGGRQQIRAAHHVPRVRPAGDVAVRLHDDQRPVRHDRRRTRPRWRPSAGRWPRPTATRPARRATCTSAPARRATTSTASTGSSPTRSRCRSRTTRTIRASPPRPVGTRKPCST